MSGAPEVLGHGSTYEAGARRLGRGPTTALPTGQRLRHLVSGAVAMGRRIAWTARTRPGLVEGAADRVEDERDRDHENDQPHGIENIVSGPRRHEQPKDADHADYAACTPPADMVHRLLLWSAVPLS